MIIRPWQESDKPFIVSLALRFAEGELMGWRDPGLMKEAQLRIAQESVDRPEPGTEVFVAEEENGRRLGFLEVKPHKDALTGIEQGSIVAVAVAPESEGGGVGRRLLLKAEEWAREQGFKQIVLSVFAGNERALNLYKQLNYEADVVKMVKEL
ncbi:GNAT family N-acetyltransferase [Paenibacillus mucilaginosus]|uniref:Ribosomal-protein-alanine acetyltransferase n=1 Tax=Paenibacillus mucilaginosus (strain KNP414) TaxID=1036673 RepID=F8FJU5_PAEMK|nr:GNAT family N-acetyltransferase [Paenibacillus mucilaginosus]AEI43426.1 ribosomal-protein-alanine acetyltransferase [Paenibacillus mucilaginosus KNP414]MCG7212028.1 GNAT family N-acetyltransferase [Paenibacillus mucilaginosus]WDM24985.1 GNAT family N-acetyltransferase [Paenibacillus mucilaginosus]